MARTSTADFSQTLGITRAPGTTNDGVPAIDVPGYADMGDSDIFQPEDRKNSTFQFTDSLVWVKGRHTFQFGGDLRRLRLFYLVEDFGQGIFQFDDGASSVSGTAFSDFLLGRPFLSYAQAGNSGGNDRLDYLGAYFTDEFHVTPRFSLTYGLREEFLLPAGQHRRTRVDSRSHRRRALHRAQQSRPGRGVDVQSFHPATEFSLWLAIHDLAASGIAQFPDPAGLEQLGAAPGLCLRPHRRWEERAARRLGRFQFPDGT